MYPEIEFDPTRANVFVNGNLMCTVHPNDPIVHWLKIAADWQTYTPTAQASLRIITTRAVRHFFKELADDYEPSPVWYPEELYEGGIESLWRIGGTWDRNKLTPYLLILQAIGLTDDEITDLLAPIHQRNLETAYGLWPCEDPDDLTDYEAPPPKPIKHCTEDVLDADTLRLLNEVNREAKKHGFYAC